MHKIKLNREIDSWGYARYLLEYDLSQIPAEEPVILEVDSLGGDVMEAISISNMLQERGNITAHIVGFCASAATWLCYACDKVIINDDCAFLIHKCSTYVDAWGMMNADEIEQLIDKLKSEKKSNEAIDLIIANKYVKHAAGKTDMKGILKLMKEERWILPTEALGLGLVDEVSTDHFLSKTNMAARLHVMNKMTSLPPLPDFLTQSVSQEDAAPAHPFSADSGSAAAPPPSVSQGDAAPAHPFSADSGSAAAPTQSVSQEDAAPTQQPFSAGSGSAAAPTQQPERSFLQQLKAALTEFFGGSVARLAPITPSSDRFRADGPLASQTSTTNTIMNQEFTFINSLLGCEHLEETDGRISLSVDDLKKINDRLAEMETLRGQADTLTTERDAARQDLTDATTAIDGISDEIAALPNIAEKVTAIKDVLSHVAGSTTETHAENEGNGHEVATDPVNRIVQPYRR